MTLSVGKFGRVMIKKILANSNLEKIFYLLNLLFFWRKRKVTKENIPAEIASGDLRGRAHILVRPSNFNFINTP